MAEVRGMMLWIAMLSLTVLLVGWLYVIVRCTWALPEYVVREGLGMHHLLIVGIVMLATASELTTVVGLDERMARVLEVFVGVAILCYVLRPRASASLFCIGALCNSAAILVNGLAMPYADVSNSGSHGLYRPLTAETIAPILADIVLVRNHGDVVAALV
jgi:hypothetical protein